MGRFWVTDYVLLHGFPSQALSHEVLTEDGELITFGQGASGRLGTGAPFFALRNGRSCLVDPPLPAGGSTGSA